MIEQIRQKQTDPAGLENLYQVAVRQKTEADFAQGINSIYSESPGNLLFAAWHYRLQAAAETARQILWKFAIPLSILCGLILWYLSDEDFSFIDYIPLFIVFAGPVAATSVLAFLGLSTQKRIRLAVSLAVGLLALTAYALLVVPTMVSWAQKPTANLVAIHLPVLSLAAVGIYLTGWRTQAERRFAFVIKTYEVATTGGLFAVAIGVFALITSGLFQALNIRLPDVVMRLIFAGGGGMLPVLAVAIIYNPQVPAEEQDFHQGLSKFLASLLRIMILPTLFVAVLYVFFIPFNFMEPFYNRDVLFIYNGMLFAVMALLVGATPIHAGDISPRLQVWLRYAIMAVAALAVLVSLYALAAILYRTFMDTLTMNRLTVIGWNIINIAVLGLLLYRQFSSDESLWAPSLKRAFNFAAVAYTVWAAFIVVAVPLIYH